MVLGELSLTMNLFRIIKLQFHYQQQEFLRIYLKFYLLFDEYLAFISTFKTSGFNVTIYRKPTLNINFLK